MLLCLSSQWQSGKCEDSEKDDTAALAKGVLMLCCLYHDNQTVSSAFLAVGTTVQCKCTKQVLNSTAFFINIF